MFKCVLKWLWKKRAHPSEGSLLTWWENAKGSKISFLCTCLPLRNHGSFRGWRSGGEEVAAPLTHWSQKDLQREDLPGTQRTIRRAREAVNRAPRVRKSEWTKTLCVLKNDRWQVKIGRGKFLLITPSVNSVATDWVYYWPGPVLNMQRALFHCILAAGQGGGAAGLPGIRGENFSGCEVILLVLSLGSLCVSCVVRLLFCKAGKISLSPWWENILAEEENLFLIAPELGRMLRVHTAAPPVSLLLTPFSNCASWGLPGMRHQCFTGSQNS